MTPLVRKLCLTAHVGGSVGWLGAVGAFFVLSVVGLTSKDPGTTGAAYIAMNLLGEFLIVPLSFIAFASGLVQSLGTPWGLFRYRWVLMKFALTLGATAILILHQFTAVAAAANRAMEAHRAGTLPAVGELGPQLVGDSGLAIVVLLTITTLSIYKPWGRTRYGRRVQESERRDARHPPS